MLSDVIGFELFNVEREQSTGNFNVDFLAEDSSGNTVIIENQLEKSNHNYLGKLITYLTAFEEKKPLGLFPNPARNISTPVHGSMKQPIANFISLKLKQSGSAIPTRSHY